MIHDDTSWYMMIPNDTWWYLMIHDDTSWYMMIPTIPDSEVLGNHHKELDCQNDF
jgi:hypothetical protein